MNLNRNLDIESVRINMCVKMEMNCAELSSFGLLRWSIYTIMWENDVITFDRRTYFRPLTLCKESREAHTVLHVF